MILIQPDLISFVKDEKPGILEIPGFWGFASFTNLRRIAIARFLCTHLHYPFFKLFFHRLSFFGTALRVLYFLCFTLFADLCSGVGREKYFGKKGVESRL
jgi:hypothetical protein